MDEQKRGLLWVADLHKTDFERAILQDGKELFALDCEWANEGREFRASYQEPWRESRKVRVRYIFPVVYVADEMADEFLRETDARPWWKKLFSR